MDYVQSSSGSGPVTMVVEDGIDENISAEEKKAAVDVTTHGGGSIRIPQFDVVSQSPPDHHFLKDTEQVGIDLIDMPIHV